MKIIEFKSSYSDPFWLLSLIELCAILDAIVFILSLGHIKTNLRTTLLFSEWADNVKEKKLTKLFKRVKK